MPIITDPQQQCKDQNVITFQENMNLNEILLVRFTLNFAKDISHLHVVR
jgi:hypothetical protein